MDQETLYTAAKWDVLKALSSNKKSPIELASVSNTSVSNISQSLRFLELAGIVKSERIGNRDKGQPRVMYSLTGNQAYLIVTTKDFVDKKQIAIDENKKIFLKIWFYKDEFLQPYLERAVMDLTSNLEKINGIYLDMNSGNDIKLLIYPADKTKLDLKDKSIVINKISRKIKYKLADEKELNSSKNSLYALHDPQNKIGGDED